MHTLFTITAQHISLLRKVSYTTARKEWNALRDALSLSEKEPLKLRDVAAYYGVPTQDLAEALYNYKAK
ncbi:MAG: hypothetical protein ACRYFX_12715 [Janthinobacterium lividum]